PPLIRFTAAFLDQGLGRSELPERRRGLFSSFHHLYRSPLVALGGRFGRAVRACVRSTGDASAVESLRESLHRLGVHDQETREFLLQTALALRGWAGMVHHVEERPDRLPVAEVPARLLDFLAVRLLLEVA